MHMAVAGVGASWRGVGTTSPVVFFGITTAPGWPVPWQGVSRGDDRGLDRECHPAVLPGQCLGTVERQAGGAQAAEPNHGVRYACECWARRLAQPRGQHSKARQERLGVEGLAQQSCGGFCWAAGSWVAAAPAGSWGCTGLCQLLLCPVGPGYSQIGSSVPLAQLGRGDVPPAPAFPPQVLAGQGTQLGLGACSGRGEKRGDRGLRLCRSPPHLHARRLCTSGPAPKCGRGPVCTPCPSHIQPLEPAQGWAGGGGGGRLPAGRQGALAARSPRFHPACRRTRFGPSSLQGQAEGGWQAAPGPASPSSLAACAPASLPDATQPLPPRPAPATPPAFPGPRSRSGGERGSGTAPSPAGVHPCIQCPGRRHGGQRPGPPLAPFCCCHPPEPTLTM